jgi:hypothetical protein
MRRILCTALLLSGCATAPPPQSADDFRGSVQADAHFTRRETVTVNRDFPSILKDIQKNGERCLNVTVRTEASGKPRLNHYRIRITPRGANKAQVAVQVVYSPKTNEPMPPGGFYQVVAELEEIWAAQTRLTLYGLTDRAASAAYQSLKSWAGGADLTCPKLD